MSSLSASSTWRVFCLVIERQEQELLDPHRVVAERPRPHGLADDRDFVSELTAEDLDRLDQALRVAMLEHGLDRVLDVVR